MTHLNREEIANIKQFERYLHKIGSRHFLLVGDLGQRIALGRWDGTRFVETEFIVDRELFSYGGKLSFSTKATFDGYFIIDFKRPSSGTYILVAAYLKDNFGRDTSAIVQIR